MINISDNINTGQFKGLFIATGEQGSGKTAFIVKLLVDNLKGRKIFSNIEIKGFNFKRITLKPLDYFIPKDERDKRLERTGYYATDIELDNYNKGKLYNILEELNKDQNYFNNSIMILDEIHVYLDSRDFFKKYNRPIQTFMSQLRKRNILLLATTQHLLNVDVRVRRQTLNVFEMIQQSKGIFNVTTYKVNDYYMDQISSYLVDLSGYFKYYNTNEIVI